MQTYFDVIGDIHGELPALEKLGNALGYDVHNGWRHPHGRALVFLGDLVDRGKHSWACGRAARFLHYGKKTWGRW